MFVFCFVFFQSGNETHLDLKKKKKDWETSINLQSLEIWKNQWASYDNRFLPSINGVENKCVLNYVWLQIDSILNNNNNATFKCINKSLVSLPCEIIDPFTLHLEYYF